VQTIGKPAGLLSSGLPGIEPLATMQIGGSAWRSQIEALALMKNGRFLKGFTTSAAQLPIPR